MDIYICTAKIFSKTQNKNNSYFVGAFTSKNEFKSNLSTLLNCLTEINSYLVSYKFTKYKINLESQKVVYVSILPITSTDHTILDVGKIFKTNFGVVSSNVLVIKAKLNYFLLIKLVKHEHHKCLTEFCKKR